MEGKLSFKTINSEETNLEEQDCKSNSQGSK